MELSVNFTEDVMQEEIINLLDYINSRSYVTETWHRWPVEDED